MLKKTPERLAFSEYVSPDPANDTQVDRARQVLIEAARRVLPRFLQQLGNVYPAYASLSDSKFNFDDILWSPNVSPYRELPPTSNLRISLDRWATEFNVNADWLIDD